ncbi:MAG TPA: hypothetical protein VLH08_16060, partial [Acidobacteriota bacterium]|nr:hypothetical protein [Acidobacteriota bacterium]
MKNVACAVLILIACYSLLLGQTEQTSVIAIRASRIWDGQSQNPMANGIVIVENGKIKTVGNGVEIPNAAKVIDLGDVTLLPGFIDLHVHVSGEMGQNFLQTFYQNLRMNVAEQSIRASMFAQRILDAGF